MLLEYSHQTIIRVRYGETDQMGYCYYGNYAQYFEVGRVETLRSLGMSYKRMEQQGVLLPVSEFQVKFKAPAFYDDELTILTKIISLKGVRIYFEYEIFNQKKKQISTATTTLVFVDKETMSPIQVPENFKKIIAKFEKNESVK